jgi:hypothetical protein
MHRRPRNPPVTSYGFHLRRGQQVLWLSDDGHYLLARVTVADSTSRRAGISQPHALLTFPNGIELLSPLDRVHPLPNHGPYSRHRATARR